MRLIDADALKEHKFVDTDDNYRIGWNDALDAVANCEPTVDAVPVIRCKDCKHYVDEQCDRYADETLGYVHSTQAEGYCWVAERKEE